MNTTSNRNTHHHKLFLDLCQQYVIAGWLTTDQYHNVVVVPIQQMNDNENLNDDDILSKMEKISEQIQSIISKAQQHQQQKYQSSNDEDGENEAALKPSTSKSATVEQQKHNDTDNKQQYQHHNHHVTWVDQSQQQKNNREDESILNVKNENTSGIYTIPHEFYQSAQQLKGFSIKELFVEMCFFARLGYVQPPCCLHCTYTEYYNENMNKIKDGKQSNNKKCNLPVVWRKDTSIVLHPDTIASNIMIVPCYIVREVLLLHQLPRNPNMSNSSLIPINHIINTDDKDGEQQQYQYDLIKKIIVSV